MIQSAWRVYSRTTGLSRQPNGDVQKPSTPWADCADSESGVSKAASAAGTSQAAPIVSDDRRNRRIRGRTQRQNRRLARELASETPEPIALPSADSASGGARSTGATSPSTGALDLVRDFRAGVCADPTALGGSAGHPFSCNEPCRFASKPRGCKDGDDCPRCHMCPWRKPADPTLLRCQWCHKPCRKPGPLAEHIRRIHLRDLSPDQAIVVLDTGEQFAIDSMSGFSKAGMRSSVVR